MVTKVVAWQLCDFEMKMPKIEKETVISKIVKPKKKVSKVERKVTVQPKKIKKVRKAQDALRVSGNLGRHYFTSMGVAPYHDVFGSGERMHFVYNLCDIARSGASSQTNWNTPPNTENMIFRVPVTDTSSSTTFSAYFGSINTDPVSPASTSSMISCWANSLTGTTGNYLMEECRPLTEIKYHNVFLIRQASVHYKPSVAKTVSGTLAFAAQRNASFAYTGTASTIEERTFQSVSSIPGAITGAVCEPIDFIILKDRDMSKPSMYTPGHSNTGAVNAQFTILAAVDTLLPTDQTDKLGSLQFDVVVDFYGGKWIPEPMHTIVGSMPPVELKEAKANFTGSSSSCVSSTSSSESSVALALKAACVTDETIKGFVKIKPLKA